MTHILNLSQDNPVIHLKAYSSVQIEGVDRAEAVCIIDTPQLATLTEEDGHVYITVNDACRLELPVNASIEIERAMGSMKIQRIKGVIKAEKVLSNLILSDIGSASIGMIGGSFSVQQASGDVQVDKVAGNLTVEDVMSFDCYKVGGGCTLVNIKGECRVKNAGGKCLATGLQGGAILSKFGGSIKASDVRFLDDVKAGGSITLFGCEFDDEMGITAGGNIKVISPVNLQNSTFKLRSGAQRIQIKTSEDDITSNSGEYDHQIGDGSRKIKMSAGGSILIKDKDDEGDDFIGDLTSRFIFKESPITQIIQERVLTATQRAEEKVKAAEARLEKIKEHAELQRDMTLNLGIDALLKSAKDTLNPKEQWMMNEEGISASTAQSLDKKGTTNEERLFILQMLQDKKITVDEAEALFKAMEG